MSRGCVYDDNPVRDTAVFYQQPEWIVMRCHFGNPAAGRLVQIYLLRNCLAGGTGFFDDAAEQKQGAEDQEKSQKKNNGFDQF